MFDVLFDDKDGVFNVAFFRSVLATIFGLGLLGTLTYFAAPYWRKLFQVVIGGLNGRIMSDGNIFTRDSVA